MSDSLSTSYQNAERAIAGLKAAGLAATTKNIELWFQFAEGRNPALARDFHKATRADGTGLPGSSDLFFSDQFSLNSFLFISLDQRGDLTKKVPFLKGSRVAFRVQNVLNDYIKVRDSNGDTPLSYQRGFLDPQGRVFELSFRKRF